MLRVARAPKVCGHFRYYYCSLLAISVRLCTERHTPTQRRHTQFWRWRKRRARAKRAAAFAPVPGAQTRWVWSSSRLARRIGAEQHRQGGEAAEARSPPRHTALTNPTAPQQVVRPACRRVRVSILGGSAWGTGLALLVRPFGPARGGFSAAAHETMQRPRALF